MPSADNDDVPLPEEPLTPDRRDKLLASMTEFPKMPEPEAPLTPEQSDKLLASMVEFPRMPEPETPLTPEQSDKLLASLVEFPKLPDPPDTDESFDGNPAPLDSNRWDDEIPSAPATAGDGAKPDPSKRPWWKFW